jgi:hypothetical protein
MCRPASWASAAVWEWVACGRWAVVGAAGWWCWGAEEVPGLVVGVDASPAGMAPRHIPSVQPQHVACHTGKHLPAHAMHAAAILLAVSFVGFSVFS